MVSEDRQRVIETNRSLRTIKNELESLLEKGVITDDAFDSIHNLLPTESSLSGAPTPAPRNRTNVSSPPTAAVANLNLHAPPSYAQSTGSSSTTATNNTNNNTPSSGPPALPGRTPPPPTTGPAVIGHARALYRYAASDTGDCAFERDDRIAVHRHMNADWWMGRNLRTGEEGIFPRSYVEEESAGPPPLPPPSAWQGRDEKAGGYQQQPAYGGQYQPPMQPTYGGGQGGAYPPPPPGQANPYNANAPPMAVAEQGTGGGGSKGSETGKKIGKKLGNAAIFGAGATIGSNIVNSIF